MTLESFCEELDCCLCGACDCVEKVQHTEHMLNKLSQADLSCCDNWACQGECYARHLVYQGKKSGCCIVAMTWGPGQGTPVHDHDGTWCVECCLEGRLEVIRYELLDTVEHEKEPCFLFREVESQTVGVGEVGALIPPFEHHVIRNPFKERAVTLHIYGRELKKASCFEPLGGERYRRVEKPLGYASA